MEEALVSVVVPVYNMGSSIGTCVNSLIDQSYKNLEIILIDDGSKDNSLEECNKLKKKDNRIQVFHTENKGSGPARNLGIEKANGRYIYFPDADDKVEKKAIELMIKATENGQYNLVVFGYKSLDKKGSTVLLKKYPEMKKKGMDIRNNYSNYAAATRKYGIQGAPWNKLFDLSLVKKYHVEFPALRRHQDEGFISRYMSLCENVHFIEDVLYVHYLNDLKKEWDKYPVDYINSVIGLYKIKKSTILTWNEKDINTQKIVNQEYICNTIKALEMSYSPKSNISNTDRVAWISEQLKLSKVLDVIPPDTLGYYQQIVFKLLKENRIRAAMLLMRIKIEVEKRNALVFFRR